MNKELENHLKAAQDEREGRQRRQEAIRHAGPLFRDKFAEVAEWVIKPALDSVAETLVRHGHGCHVQLFKNVAPDTDEGARVQMTFSPEHGRSVGSVATMSDVLVQFFRRTDQLKVECRFVFLGELDSLGESKHRSAFFGLEEITREGVERLVAEFVKGVVKA